VASSVTNLRLSRSVGHNTRAPFAASSLPWSDS
jgi:hypothetical protein